MRATRPLLAAVVLALTALTPARAVPASTTPGAFGLLWERYDRPVAEGRAGRSWTWGPLPLTEPVGEPFTLFRGLPTAGLLQPQAPVGYQQQHVGLSPAYAVSTAAYPTSCRK